MPSKWKLISKPPALYQCLFLSQWFQGTILNMYLDMLAETLLKGFLLESMVCCLNPRWWIDQHGRWLNFSESEEKPWLLWMLLLLSSGLIRTRYTRLILLKNSKVLRRLSLRTWSQSHCIHCIFSWWSHSGDSLQSTGSNRPFSGLMWNKHGEHLDVSLKRGIAHLSLAPQFVVNTMHQANMSLLRPEDLYRVKCHWWESLSMS